MKKFFEGFEKKSNLLVSGAKLLTKGVGAVARNPGKSLMGGFLASDMASAAQKASRQAKMNKVTWAGPYRY